MKTLLLTGAGGFIGSHFVEYFLRNTDWNIICIDSFRHKGTYSRLDDIELNRSRVEIFHHDLNAPIDEVLEDRLNPESIDYIVNLASNSAVERSVHDPVECWRNNCNIIVNMLEFARKCKNLALFVHVSTDEVYGDYSDLYRDIDSVGFKEWSTIVPSNPYAASKAAQEALCIAYWRSYTLPIIICNTMNNIGERQDPEKFLPKIVQSVSTGKTVKIYVDSNGTPGSRVYLDAQNHASAILFLLNSNHPSRLSGANIPGRYNVCGDIELDNLQLAIKVATLMEKMLKYETVPSCSLRPGYDNRYLLDGTKLKTMGWKPPIKFDETLKRIIDHYKEKPYWTA